MQLTELSLRQFADQLADRTATPGGGAAAALAGAVGMALGQMAARFTEGKKKFAHLQPRLAALLQQAEELRGQLLAMAQADAEAYLPLAQAYALPRQTPQELQHRQQVLEQALRGACAVPLEVMALCAQAIQLHQELAGMVSPMLLSDVGVGVACCRGALAGSMLNVQVNTQAMADRAFARQADARARALLEEYLPLADQVYSQVAAKLEREA